MDRLVFVDVETTGLDPAEHEIWEVAMQVDNRHITTFRLEPTRMESASEIALKVGGFRERTADEGWDWDTPEEAVSHMHQLTEGAHLVGMNVSFDAAFLAQLYLEHDYDVNWHYHLIDLEAMMLGFIAALGGRLPVPWKSSALSTNIGVTPPDRTQIHTAEGDVEWAHRVWARMVEST